MDYNENTPITVGMVALGCSKNQVDAELMLGTLKKEGFVLSADPANCDAVIVNTCGFIESAKRESIETVLEFCGKIGKGRIKVVAVTGCLAQRYQEELAKEIPEAGVVLTIGANSEIGAAIKKALAGERVTRYCPPEELVMEGERVLANEPFYAYLRIADGCDNRCAYCAIPMIRGRFRSRKMEDIIAEAERFAEKGVTEFNVIAQDTTRYGEDLYGEKKLPELLKRICAIDGVKLVRVLYAYPDHITDELLTTIATEEKIAKYLDIPLQHASKKVLSAMNRHGDMLSTLSLIKKIRTAVPGIVLRTTILTGFPGESEEDFETLCKFVKMAKFERLGCFAYSQEEGTPAGEMEDQIDEETKERRAEVVMEIQTAISSELCKKQVGKTLEVVVENWSPKRDMYCGRSFADAPDIDGRVYFESEKPLKLGDYVNVLIEKSSDYDLCGKAID